ncbi:hypothetical protein [Paenibacillus hexagrammi]|uniref:Uncharacterized protein n=1 Tax=Paenibacillus hexagrammi TaxID=2908839 RepID=A0ABY3SP28_9BACL|nr:hypothetical protein [Paenibacillus sp. YPD9-1]UJF35714.1 hypothetical protein L0M14_11845 [Paenibacillus sp. YPD9-1]
MQRKSLLVNQSEESKTQGSAQSTYAKTSADSPAAPAVSPRPHAQWMGLQRTIGNKAVEQYVRRQVSADTAASGVHITTGQPGNSIQRHIKSEVLNYNATTWDGMEDMDAVIGSSSHWARGTPPQPGVPQRIQHVGAIKGRYVGGHMMNQEWGGDGDYTNMIILSSSANGKHRRIDGMIRTMGQIAARLEDYRINDSTHGDGTRYEFGVKENIVVDDPAPNNTENFPAEKEIPKGFTVTLEPVKRPKNTNNPFTDWTEQSAYKNSYYIDNVPPYPDAPTTGRKRIKKIKKKTFSTKHLKLSVMKAKDFANIKGIGKKKAGNLKSAFRQYPNKSAEALIRAIENKTAIGQQLIALGVSRADLVKVHFRK